jgi:protoporphyrinogen oxidase
VAHVDIAVLGAGPAGLGAAWWAARKGARVIVLERAPGPGGATASFDVAGVRVDHGSHRLHAATDPFVMTELRSLLGDELQERPRNGRIRLAGRWIGFPLTAGDLIRHLPPSFAAGAAFDTLTSPLRRPRADTFDEVVRAGLGPTMWRRFYAPYARKIWGVDPAHLAGEQARKRITADTPGKMLRRVLRGGSSGPATFFYPRRGFGAIAEALSEAAESAGAQVRYDATVTSVRFGDAARVRTADGQSVTAQRIWSTLPLTALAAMTDPSPELAVSAAAGSLRFRAMVLVYLVLPIARWTAYDAHYLPEGGTPVTRVSEPKNYRARDDDPPDRTVLCAEVPCTPGDGVWEADDDALGALVAGGLERQGLPPVRPESVVVRRLEHAYPIYAAGYERHFAALDAWAAAQPGLLTFGRQGLFAHDNTHHALAMAWAAAAAWEPGGGFDDAAWAEARERFRSHVVED